MRWATAIVLGTALPMVACRSAKRVEEQRVADAFSRFSQCVVGAPLGKDENPRARLRSIELALVGDLGQETRPPNERWPQRCKGETSAFHSALAQQKQNRSSEVEALQAKLYAATVALDARSHLKGLAEILGSARAQGLQAIELPGARRAPEAARTLMPAPEPVPLQYAFGGSAPLTLQPIGVWDRGEKRLCADPFGKQPIACKKIDPGVREPTIAASEGGELWYYDAQKANRDRELVVHSLNGATRRHALEKDFVAHGVRVEQNALLTLDASPDEHRFTVALEREGHAPERVGGTYDPRGRAFFQAARPPFLVGELVVIESKTGIHVRRILREPLRLSTSETVLASESVLPIVEGGQTILIGYATRSAADSGVAIHDGTRWFSHQVDFFMPRALTSASGRITFYAMGDKAPIREVRCSTEGCTTRNQSLELRDHAFCGPSFAPLGEQAVVMWRSHLGDVRMRIGPLAGIDSVEDRIVFDEGLPTDDASASECIQLISRGNRALAVIQSFRGGRIPLLIDASGNATPVSLR